MSAAADRVEEAHELWHRGHLDLAGGDQSGDAARGQADRRHADGGRRDQVLPRDDRDRRGDGQRHGGRGQQVAAPRGRGVVHPMQADDEADGRDQEQQVRGDVEGAHDVTRSGALNISSIRSVTT
jgi:hypothetical protein